MQTKEEKIGNEASCGYIYPDAVAMHVLLHIAYLYLQCLPWKYHT